MIRIITVFLFFTMAASGQTVEQGKKLWEQHNNPEAKKALATIKKDKRLCGRPILFRAHCL
ncbi:MAG: hypothetical protein IPK96_00860 [Flammeovirgaceae bacterium]|nr:hypothetical protein [Flammeovirgaceae bacterium]